MACGNCWRTAMGTAASRAALGSRLIRSAISARRSRASSAPSVIRSAVRFAEGVLVKISLHCENLAIAVDGSFGGASLVEPFIATAFEVWDSTELAPARVDFEVARGQNRTMAMTTDTTRAENNRIRRGI